MTDSRSIKKGEMISGVRRYDRRVWYQGSESRALAKRFFFFFALCMLLLFAILVSPKAVGTNTPLLFSYGNIGCNNLVQFRVTDPFAAPTWLWLLLLLLRTLPTPSLHPLGASAGEEAARIDRRRRTKNHLPYFDTQTRVTPKFGIPE